MNTKILITTSLLSLVLGGVSGSIIANVSNDTSPLVVVEQFQGKTISVFSTDEKSVKKYPESATSTEMENIKSYKIIIITGEHKEQGVCEIRQDFSGDGFTYEWVEDGVRFLSAVNCGQL